MKKLMLAALALFVLPATVQADHHKETAKKNIVETAVAAKFNTLVAAVEAGGLVETLSGEGPFTVFAPTDEAFGKLPKGTLETLLKPENKDQLVQILKYHVVAAKVPAAKVVELKKADTLAGEVTIEVKDGTVMLNDKVKVVKTDVMATNGVIHVIDTVLLPPSK
ncbi:fasciclin domain-containing protein [Rhodopirellula sp. JC740]|uniref:Fasciclin domain-containing protein n=1 Tax=Rhodopirellula halodulae TaxID=2894198 RepID=A0ABS8NEU7_9BACT|nr:MULTISPECIES: fasciclin domain-containing protein [unclassified Rhodopirellula]MCC9641452.1 fasciclin domain-containing protein [Rhodopirellula sp. JC740]MCC9657860.1 fasciclin domain-containing protein [Rhodopirellula sp. JC737]